MTRMFFGAENCQGATSGLTGRNYDAKNGFINVTDPKDVAFFRKNGYSEAGGLPHLSKYWECECGWQSHINSCPQCNRTDLTKVEL